MSRKSMLKSRGYFGIGVYHPKTEENIGTLWREALLFGASFIFTIGRRYSHQSSDTPKTYRHIPLWEFTTFEEFEASVPKLAKKVFVEMVPSSRFLDVFSHPEQAVYILGAEDYGIPAKLIKPLDAVVQIPQVVNVCSSNVAVSGSIVLYDRLVKNNAK